MLVLLTLLSLTRHCIILFVSTPVLQIFVSGITVITVISTVTSVILCQSFSLALRNSFGRAEEVKLITSTQFPRWGQTLQLELKIGRAHV